MEQPTSYTNEDGKVTKPRLGGVWWGLVLIIGGLIVLAQQAGWIGPRYNWWALFILVPAFATLTGAVYDIQKHRRLTTGGLSAIGSALIIFTVAFIFLFGLDWSYWWPLMIFVPGFAMLLGGIETGGKKSANSTGLINMAFWLGLGIMYLGAGFLGKNLGWFSPQVYFGPYEWWAVAIIIPAVGAFLDALIVAVRNQSINGSVIGLVFFGLLAGATGAVAFLGLNWNLLGPILLILVGATILLGVFRKK